ncbi:type II toxin-antitoxin system RelE/ParE family toxin [Rhizobium sp. XQZ8]|uniref:type II toxin-antitoxin system RelE/ParE family toxin n=1 Tax=Rhizobium populisoli TaxID=2859785 RepID=UPI001C6741A4|nr:type II toxin-antitoxin system RelE/ParE family toxin [Rhizobium populisoli]MBW6421103.1 type II toxin-antitoxin system RelE/ParE family toxin [Rhizobium populisoli]
MKYRVLLSDDAEDDIAELLTYLLPLAGEKVARRYVDRLIDHCYSFEAFPARGIVSEKRPGLRLVGYRRRATIAFRVTSDTVTIVRIFNKGRNVDFEDELESL